MTCESCYQKKKKCEKLPYYRKCVNCAGDGSICEPRKEKERTFLRKTCDNCHNRKKKCIRKTILDDCEYCKEYNKNCEYSKSGSKVQYYHVVRKLKLMTNYYNTLLTIKRTIQDYQSRIIETEQDLKTKLSHLILKLPLGEIRTLITNLYWDKIEPEGQNLERIVKEIDKRINPEQIISEINNELPE